MYQTPLGFLLKNQFTSVEKEKITGLHLEKIAPHNNKTNSKPTLVITADEQDKSKNFGLF